MPLGRRPPKRSAPPLAAAAAVAGGVVAAAASGALLRRRGGSSASGAAPAQGDAPAHAEWQCACGQEFRVSGEGRHRVLWLPDAGSGDPYLEPTCPSCERELASQD